MSNWIKCSDRLPHTPSNSDTTFIVTVKRAHNGHQYVFAADWLNKKLLIDEDDPEPDGTSVTGWYELEPNDEYDQCWVPLIQPSSGDEVTHWMPMPEPPQ